jgi:hypothetical protein
MPSSERECGMVSEHKKALLETKAPHPYDGTPFDKRPLHPEGNLYLSNTMSAMNAESLSCTVSMDD